MFIDERRVQGVYMYNNQKQVTSLQLLHGLKVWEMP